MGKGYLTGVLFGTVVSALGLLAALLAAPPVQPVGPAEIAVNPAPDSEAGVSQEETAAAEPEAASQTPAPEVTPVAPAAEVAAAPAAPASAPVVEAAPAPQVAAPVVEAAPAPVAPAAEPEAAPAAEAPAAVAEAPAPAAEPAPGAAADSGEAIFKALNEALAEAKAAAEKEAASAPPAVAPAPATPTTTTPDTAPAAPLQTADAKPAAELPKVTVPAPPAPAATIEAAPAPAPQTSGEAPAVPAVPAASNGAAVPVAEEVQPVSPAARPLAEVAPAVDQPAATPEPAPVPAATPAPVPEAIPAPEPETEVAEAVPPAGADAAPAPRVIDIAPRPPLGATGAPKPGFGVAVPGVRINRLPRIGDEVAAANDLPGTPIAPPSGEATPEVIAPTPEPTETLSAVERFRAPFTNAENKPVISVLLLDVGAAKGGVDPERLAQLGVPVTVAIDPESGDAAARAAAFRLAGDEVAILAPDLPAGATASDMEVSYQAYAAALPEAVALTAAPDAAFLRDRKQAQHLVALLATEGRGIVSYPRGLDPAGQAARGLGLPAASVDRVIDAAGEDSAAIQRYLERAAFDAARKPGVVIVGSTSAETVAALEAWIAGGGKGTVLGPVSVAMAPAK